MNRGKRVSERERAVSTVPMALRVFRALDVPSTSECIHIDSLVEIMSLCASEMLPQVSM